MDVNLTIYDMDLFLDKYTRFMTKDIYISNKMYANFLGQYDYLYQILKKDRFLYSDNKKYKKMLEIDKNKNGLIRLHNQKYLQGAKKKYKTFFDDMMVKLDERKRLMVLLEEENTYVVMDQNYEALVYGKVKFLLEYKNYLDKDILILTDDDGKASGIRELFNTSNVKVSILNVKEYGNRLVNRDLLIDNNKRYDILINYIMNDLFIDKDKFNSFYKAFSKYIYLNKDYLEYETFRDYHNYMYKRKYLASGLSLKKFNEQEIKLRKTYLRTIKNEILKERYEVDVANFLYLNSIDYVYDEANSLFRLDNNVIVKFLDKEGFLDNNKLGDRVICLYPSNATNKNYLEVLAYELVKFRFPLEHLMDDEVYNKLKNTNIDNYFSEFLNKYLIPLVKYYDNFNNLDDVNMDKGAKFEFLKVYDEYSKCFSEMNLVLEKDWLKIIEDDISKKCYKYLFLIGDMDIKVNIPIFNIVSDYPKTELIKENIKLLYDYKKYLYANQIIPINNTYLSRDELNGLTKRFLKDNLEIINNFLAEVKKEVKIVSYDDSNRLHIYRNIGNSCLDILKSLNKNSLIVFENLSDSKFLVGNGFMKLDKKTFLTDNKVEIGVEKIINIDKIYDNIILPYLIKDSYHEDLFDSDYQYNVKLFIYMALNKCRKSLIIICPESKKSEALKLVSGIGK